MKRVSGLFAIAFVALLPLLADRIRADGARCAYDGAPARIDYRVRLLLESGEDHDFCGTRCAEAWLVRTAITPRAVLVTDTQTGTFLDAREATFLRSLASLDAGAPDAIRVFGTREAAALHASAFGGAILEGEERPFLRAGLERRAHAQGPR